MARKVSIVMDQALNYRSKYEINVSTAVLKPKHKSGYSKTKLVYKKIVNTLMVLTIMLMVTVSSSGTPAQAFELPNPIEDAKDSLGNMANDLTNSIKEAMCFNEFFAPGTEGVSEPLLDTGVDQSRLDGSKKRTGYEQWGMAGPTLLGIHGYTDPDKAPDFVKEAGYKPDNAMYTDSCFPMMQAASTLSGNGLLLVAKGLTWATNMILGMSIGDEKMQEDLTVWVVNILVGEDGNSGLRQFLYLDFMGPAAMIGALVIGYRGMAQRQATRALTHAAGMMASAILTMVFLSAPTPIIGTLVKMNSDLGGEVLVAMLKTTGVDGAEDNMCSVDGTGKQDILRTIQCTLWRNNVVYPWIKMQYGSSYNAEAVADQLSGVPSLGAADLSHNTAATWQMENQTIARGADQSEKDAKEAELIKLAMLFVGNPSNGGGGTVNEYFTGEQFTLRIGPGYEAIATAAVTAIVVIPTAVMYIGYTLIFIMLFAFVPWVGLISLAFPRLGMRLLNEMVGTAIKTIALMVYLGLTLVILTQIVATSSGTDLRTLAYLAIFCYAMIQGRGKIMDTMTGGMSNGVASILDQKVDGAQQKSGGAVAGAIAGATAATTGRFASKLTSRSDANAPSAKAAARPKAADAFNNTEDDTASHTRPPKASAPNTGTRSSQKRRDPFVSETAETSSEDGTTASKNSPIKRANAVFVQADQQAVRAESGKPSATTPVQTPSFDPTGKKAVSTSVRVEGPTTEYPKAKAEKVNIVATVAAGTVRGGVTGARAGSVAGGAQSGFNAGRQGATRNEVKATQETEVADAQREKERQDALRAMKSGSLPKASPASKPNAPRATGLPKRNEGGLPGSSKGGSPRATR